MIWRWALGLLLLTYFGLIIWLFPDYGITFDESLQNSYAELIMDWYASFFTDWQAKKFRNLHYYGGLFEVFAQLGTYILPFGHFEARHLVNGLFALLTVAFTAKTATLLSGPRAGFIAAVLLILTPRFFGHGFNNPKDVPFAFVFIFGLYYVFKYGKQCRNLSGWDATKLAVALAVAISIRVNGIIIWGLFVLLQLHELRLEQWFPMRQVFKKAWFVFAQNYKVFLAAVVISCFFWPAHMAAPLFFIFIALRVMSDFGGWCCNFYLGEYIHMENNPWHYPWVWLSHTMPEPTLLLMVVAAITGIAALVKNHPRQLVRSSRRHVFFFVLMALFPLAYVTLKRPTLYDGFRHLTFVLPPLMVVTSRGLVSYLRHLRPIWQNLALVAILCSFLPTMQTMIRLHPLQTLYFNRTVAGGVATAASQFDFEYWGSSQKLAAHWLNQAPQFALDHKPLKVHACTERLSLQYYLSDRFVYVDEYKDADLYVCNCVHCKRRKTEGQIIHEISRLDATVVQIFDKR